MNVDFDIVDYCYDNRKCFVVTSIATLENTVVLNINGLDDSDDNSVAVYAKECVCYIRKFYRNIFSDISADIIESYLFYIIKEGILCMSIDRFNEIVGYYRRYKRTVND